MKGILTIFFLLLVVPSSLQAQCEECIESLSNMMDLAREASNQNLQYAQENDRLRDTIIFFQLELANALNQRSKLEEQKQSVVIQQDATTALLDEIQKLKDELSSQQANNRLIKARQEELLEEKEKLEVVLVERENTIANLQGQIQNLEQEIDVLQDVLDCIDAFNEDRASKRAIAREELQMANRQYESLRARQQELPDSTVQQEIKKIWAVYQQYSSNRLSVTCGPYPMSVQDDYKTAKEHLYAAQILAGNEGNIVNDFGDNLNEKLNEMNEELLSQLGQAIAKGNYNIRSDANRIVANLPHLIVPERKGRTNAIVDTTTTTSTPNNAEMK